MTEYTYAAVPAEVPVLEYDALALSEEDTDAVRALVADSAIAVRAAHVYDRQVELTPAR